MHWPYCARKCPYCDFNSHVRGHMPEAEWLEGILAELEHEASLTAGQTLTSIFFGGGTPSLMTPASAGAIIDRAAALWRAAPKLEITLEANPSTVEAERFSGFRDAGINRVSLGLQALNDADLSALGRTHDAATGIAALDMAQAHFPRVSFDLIYTREGQSAADWERELRRALSFGTEHLSLYQLTIEPGTHFATRHAAGDLILPAEDPAADMFEMTRAITAEAGLPAYETSNYARPGAESRHNLTYWRYGDYAGVGPGAHGRRAGRATVRTRLPERWLSRLAERGAVPATEERIAPEKAATEALMMGLRLTEGIDAARFQVRTGIPLADAIDTEAAARLQAYGLLSWTGKTLRLTEPGHAVLNSILVDLIPN